VVARLSAGRAAALPTRLRLKIAAAAKADFALDILLLPYTSCEKLPWRNNPPSDRQVSSLRTRQKWMRKEIENLAKKSKIRACRRRT
jgi:hypothetical protein